MDDAIKKWLKQVKDAGLSDDKITQKLQADGWDKDKIIELLDIPRTLNPPSVGKLQRAVSIIKIIAYLGIIFIGVYVIYYIADYFITISTNNFLSGLVVIGGSFFISILSYKRISWIRHSLKTGNQLPYKRNKKIIIDVIFIGLAIFLVVIGLKFESIGSIVPLFIGSILGLIGLISLISQIASLASHTISKISSNYKK